MRVKAIHTWVIILLLFFVCAVHFSFGQNHKSGGSKIVWSPPDKSFTIEVPVKLKEEKETYNSTRLFYALKFGYVFKVYIFENEDKTSSSKRKFDGLEFVIGGDDDHDFTERYLKIDGLTAKEIVYTNLRAKGLMINAGDRIYILALGAFNRKDLNSAIAKRFFTSFHLLRKMNP